MVIFGGLEVVAAGYLIHKHNKNKKERERLREAEELIEEEEEALRREARRQQRQDQKTQSESYYATPPPPYPQFQPQPEHEQRRRRSDSRDRRERRHRHRRDHSEGGERRRERRREQSAPPVPGLSQMPTQLMSEPGIVTGWPSNWQQSHTLPPQSTTHSYSQQNLHPGYTVEKERRGRSVDNLTESQGEERLASRTPSPKVRFNDGSRPGDDQSPPPEYR